MIEEAEVEEKRRAAIEEEHRRVQKFESMLRGLKRELSEIPGKLREAAAALDVEQMAALNERQDEIAQEMFITKAHLLRYKLNLVMLETDELKREKRDKELIREAVTEDWREAKEKCVELEDVHGLLSHELMFIENKLVVNRREEAELRDALSDLIESQVEVQ